MRPLACLMLALSTACVGDIVEGASDLSPTDTPVALAFTSPAPGAQVVREHVEATAGWRVANVNVVLAVAGSPATIDLAGDDLALGTVDVATGRRDISLTELGLTTLTATARDAAGRALTTATIDIDVVEPAFETCREWLDVYGAAYQLGPDRPGVADPVTLTTPINGMNYRAYGAAAVRTTFFMDCTLAVSLLEAAPHLRERNIVEVTDIGVYNYRCIGGEGTPPDCPRGMSQHAYAKGIDLAVLTTADGTTYSVNDDWVIDPSTERTCDAATADEKDALLHDAICALKRDHVWNIVLTPNYNADHRNHFHVDLTTGSDFIRTRRGDTDVGPDHH